MKGYCLKKNIYFRSIGAKFSSNRPKFRVVNLNLVYIQLNLAGFELNNKKLYVYLSHFVKFGTWNFPILMEMVLCSPTGARNLGSSNQVSPNFNGQWPSISPEVNDISHILMNIVRISRIDDQKICLVLTKFRSLKNHRSQNFRLRKWLAV
jgi:hypothetical protein